MDSKNWILKNGFRDGIVNVLCVLLLVVYPLRHVGVGVDLMDGGYNYANFLYGSMEYMDSMWYFATWIANHAGALLMKLPGGGTMLGMNIYTGLFVSLLASAGFLFCTKVLRLPAVWALLGELTACSLCWAPTAVLYNYLTYLFLLGGSLFLYRALLGGRKLCFVAAGVLLGLNVGVRFSNLVQAGMILIVWGYALLSRKGWRETVRETLLCMLGYLGAAGCFLALMSLRYGFGEYLAGILRLFQMTETATDYSPGGMLFNVFKAYWECGYWLKRFLAALALELGICLILPKSWEKAKKALCLLVTAAFGFWLTAHNYFAANYITYDTIYYPCVMVLLAAYGFSLFFLIKRGTAPEERLPALFVLLTLFVTSLGSNNGVYSCFNNLFLALPFFLHMLRSFCREQRVVAAFPLKTLTAAAVLILFVQAAGFGLNFVYEEATGGVAMEYRVQGIPVLAGIKTDRKKAEQLTELYTYLENEGLRENKILLYGQIPGLAYYLEMEPALNIWSDLRSYSAEVMETDMAKLRQKAETEGELPVLVLEKEWAEYLDVPEKAAAYWDETAVGKLALIRELAEDFFYRRVFQNEKYAVYSAGGTGQ